MKNYNEKTKDMIESILPSGARKPARKNAEGIKRRSRRNARQSLHVWKGYSDAYDYEGFPHDYWGEATGWSEINNIKANMWDRRDADKLSILHWAERLCETKLAHMNDEERYQYFKKLMPDNLIGRHALGHLVDKVAPSKGRYYKYHLTSPWYLIDEGRWMTDIERHAYWEVKRAQEAVAERDKVLRILATPGMHKRLNRAIKSSHVARHWNSYRKEYTTCEFCSAPRCLMGMHDVDSFLHDIRRRPSHFEDKIFERFMI